MLETIPWATHTNIYTSVYNNNDNNLLIQSRVKTPLSERADMPAGKTHRIGGWFLSDAVASLANPTYNNCQTDSRCGNQLPDSASTSTEDTRYSENTALLTIMMS